LSLYLKVLRTVCCSIGIYSVWRLRNRQVEGAIHPPLKSRGFLALFCNSRSKATNLLPPFLLPLVANAAKSQKGGLSAYSLKVASFKAHNAKGTGINLQPAVLDHAVCIQIQGSTRGRKWAILTLQSTWGFTRGHRLGSKLTLVAGHKGRCRDRILCVVACGLRCGQQRECATSVKIGVKRHKPGTLIESDISRTRSDASCPSLGAHEHTAQSAPCLAPRRCWII
jgi:hypothetical protein